MTNDIWTHLDEYFRENSIMRATPVTASEIAAAAAELGVEFPQDYVAFVERYGGAMVRALPVIGLRQAASMGNEEASVVEVTKRFRKEGWPGVEGWSVISVDHAGNPIGMDKEGTIWKYDHDAGRTVFMASSLENFLKEKCLRLA